MYYINALRGIPKLIVDSPIISRKIASNLNTNLHLWIFVKGEQRIALGGVYD